MVRFWLKKSVKLRQASISIDAAIILRTNVMSSITAPFIKSDKLNVNRKLMTQFEVKKDPIPDIAVLIILITIAEINFER